MSERTLALAALFQACVQARSLAREGRTGCGEAGNRTLLASIFKLDTDSVIDVYGGAENLAQGLTAVERHLNSGPRDGDVLRYAVSLLHLRGKLMRDPAIAGRLRDLIVETQRQREHLGLAHPQTLSRLAEVYQETISQLGPRVVVRGERAYLSQPRTVAHIRAVLLAGVRAAVLWHQVGGRRRQLLLSRRAICAECRDLGADGA